MVQPHFLASVFEFQYLVVVCRLSTRRRSSANIEIREVHDDDSSTAIGNLRE